MMRPPNQFARQENQPMVLQIPNPFPGGEKTVKLFKEDPDLVQLLSQVDLNREIPAHLYKVVAELLSSVYKLNNAYPS